MLFQENYHLIRLRAALMFDSLEKTAKLSKTNNSKEFRSSVPLERKSSETIKFDYTVEDFFLDKYVNQVHKILKEKDLAERDKSGNVLTDKETKIRVDILAKYVCDQLSGPDQSIPCTNHYLALHIEQLKNELGSNLIPLGLLRAGLATERAILFKVLADQVGFPCALVRGVCGQTWIEVSLSSVSPPRPFYPTSLLKPTHIVDLLHSGCLLQLGSFAANKYSTCPSLCAYDTSDECLKPTCL